MQKALAARRTLGRSIVELGARDPSLVDVPLPVNSIPVVGPLASPVVGNGAGGGAQSSPQPAPASNTAGSGSSGGDGGSTPVPSDSPTDGGGNVVPPMSPVPNPASPTLVPGTPDSSPPGDPSGTSPSPSGGAVSSSGGSGAAGNLLGAGGTAPVNVGSATETSAAVDWSGSPSLASGFQSSVPSSLGSGPDAVGTAAPSPAVAAASGKQFSGGVIAGIIIVCLLALGALILLVIRRRSISRRLELRRQWLFGRAGGDLSPFNNVGVRSPAENTPACRLSARSSFATNFDQGLVFRVDSPPPRLSLGVFPEIPPMAEVRERNSVLISTAGGVARRESMNSMLSSGSDPEAQYLIVTGQDSLEPSTPMSVRPFSPSESFAFPKPPGPPSATVDTFFTSRRQRPDSPQSPVATLPHLSSPPPAFMTDLPPSSAPTPRTSTLTPTLLPSITALNYDVDPFSDPAKPEFADIEIIRRPFAPSLDDELAVSPGDHVRILQVFDDGWSQVEKLASNGKQSHERGLIPVDCLREAGQALPTFIAQKRVSAYGADHLIGTAL